MKRLALVLTLLLSLVAGPVAAETLRMMSARADMKPVEIGIFSPEMKPVQGLSAGEVGYIATGAKDVRNVRVGDTVTLAERPCAAACPGYAEAKPMVFSGLYPTDTDGYDDLKDALQKLQMNDASLTFEPETSQALGFGFRCGYLGLLHMEIVQERLEREQKLEIVTTAPTVVYRVRTKAGETLMLDNPARQCLAILGGAVEHQRRLRRAEGRRARLHGDRRGEGAEDDRRALALQPSEPMALTVLLMGSAVTGQYEDAMPATMTMLKCRQLN